MYLLRVENYTDKIIVLLILMDVAIISVLECWHVEAQDRMDSNVFAHTQLNHF